MSEHASTAGGTPHSTDGEHHPHILPLKIYFRVWAALLVLTGITVAVSYFDFGPGNMLVAMIVAMTKASLVAAFFMHLKYDNKLNAVVFSASLVFMFIFFFLTFADIGTRGWLDKAQGTFLNPHKEKVEAREAKPDEKNAAPEAKTAGKSGPPAEEATPATGAKVDSEHPHDGRGIDGKKPEQFNKPLNGAYPPNGTPPPADTKNAPQNKK